jgi:hypothetical protein
MADEPVTRVENRLDAFAERVDDRFDQMVELIKSSFRTLDQKMDRVYCKIDKVDAKVGALKRNR